MGRTAMLWGVKSSFSEYILRLPDGRFSATDGAEFLLPLTFGFESADDDLPQEIEKVPPLGAVLHFRGDARFAGHSGALFLRIADPWLHFTDEGGFVSVVGGQTESDVERRTLATFSDAALTGSAGRRLVIDDVRLDAAGVEMFNRAYEPGTRLDALSVGHLTA